VRRRRVRALGVRPVFPVHHRGGVLPARVSARALRPEPLAQAAWRQARTAAGRELASGARAARYARRIWRGVTVDTTVQPKNITFPTDAKLLHAAIRALARLARKHGLALAAVLCADRQTRGNDGGTLAHAKQFDRQSRIAHFAHPIGAHHP